MNETVLGSELREGDTIVTWWQPHRDTIATLRPYSGAYENTPDWKGVRTATFRILKMGMTIFPNETFEKIASGAAK